MRIIRMYVYIYIYIFVYMRKCDIRLRICVYAYAYVRKCVKEYENKSKNVMSKRILKEYA